MNLNNWNLSAYAVKERSLTLYFILVVAIAGVYAFLAMGRAEDPSFELNTMVVSATWPGASAQEMQDQVADPLEKGVEKIAFFDRVETKSRPGRTDLLIMFAQNTPTGKSKELYYQVRKRLGDLAPSLPKGVQGPFFNDEFDNVYFTLYSLTADKVPHQQVVQQADKMSVALRQVTGIKKVDLIGERPSKVFVDVNMRQLASMGIDLAHLQQQIQAHLQLTSAGFIDSSGPRLFLRPPSSQTVAPSVAEIAGIPIQVNGEVIPLGSLATVQQGYADPAQFLVRDRGKPSILVGAVMADGVDGLKLEAHLEAFENTYRDQLPVGFELEKVTNQADAIHSAVTTFQVKFVTALLVVLIVSLIALGIRAGLIVALAVPLTLAITFTVMYSQNLNLDRISLGALIISLGLLVDDAIIAIEMMLVKMAEGLDKAKAAAYAWSVTAAPMLVGTLITVVGFMPIGLAQSRVGDYAGGIFWVLGIALIASWFVAVYFTPYLGYKMLKAPKQTHSDAYDTPVYRSLRAVIVFCVRHKIMVVLVTVLIFIAAIVGMNKSVEKQFFPSSDRPELMIDIYLPEGSALSATDAVTKRVEAMVNEYSEVDSLSSYVGRGAPRFFLALNPELPSSNFAKIIAVTHGKEARIALQEKLQAKIAQGAFPEARVRVHPLLFGPPVPWPVTFRVVGEDANELRRIANQVREVMAQQSYTIDPHLQWGQRTPSIKLAIDQLALSQVGLTPQALSQQLNAQTQGVVAAQIGQDNRTVEVVLRSQSQSRLKIGHLGSILLQTPTGDFIPLEQVADLKVVYEDQLLERRNRELVLAVNSEVIPGMQPPVATEKLWQELASIRDNLPRGYRIDIGGSVEESAIAQASIKAMMPWMLLTMSLILMLYIRTFSGLFMVLVTAPLGLIGAVLALILFQQPYGFVANLGLIGLAGILMRNTLILTGQIDANRGHDMPLYAALIDATVRRARPVILTALAAMLAFIPLTTSTFWGPMAYVLIGGIGVGTLLTLLFLPALYALWFRIKVPSS